MAPDRSAARLSWLCPTEFERTRFLDMHRRILPLNLRLLALTLLLLVPMYPTAHNPLALVPAVVAIVGFGILQRRATHFERPEVSVFVALLGTELAIAAAVLINGSEHTGALVMILWPAVGIAGRFRTVPVIFATAYAAAVIVSAEMLHPAIVFDDPLRLTMVLCALACTTTIASVLRDSDVEHRGAAILDPLTGMLNRSALMRRAAEIEAQSSVTGQPVALVVADLDHFKRVNDEHGHAKGDQVLREAAYVMRRELRAYDLVYRMGGEEFAIVLLGAEAVDAEARAEQLRAALAREPLAGLRVTASLGVSATEPGATFEWKAEFARADAALYAAKAAGRDCVRVAGEPVAELAAAA